MSVARRQVVVFSPRVLTALVFAGLVVTTAASAQQKPPTETQKAAAAAKFEQLETAARGKATEELIAAARFAVTLHAIPEARAALSTAYVFSPGEDKVRDEYGKLAKQKNAPDKGAAAQWADRRTKAFAKCVELMTPVVAAYADADRSDELARVVSLLHDELVLPGPSGKSAPLDALKKKYELVFYAPYGDWRRKKDVTRLDGGWEILDGAWVDPKRVAELDAQHADWAHPWQFGEEVHEIKTTAPLKSARCVLMTVASYRTFVLGYLGIETDLRPPKVKLPILLAPTRAELEARMAEMPGGMRMPDDAAAIYRGGSRPGGTCFVSFEMKEQGGSLHKVDLAGLRAGVLHEVAHQIFHEYKMHALDLKKEPHGAGACNWVEEGVAEFLPSFVPVDGNWTLKRVKSPRPDAAGASGSKHSGGGGAGGNGGRSTSYEVLESGWEWCHDHANEIAPLAEFVTYDQQRMASARLYHVARVLADYLLEGKDRAYRADFCRLIEVVHEMRADDRSFAACFPGLDVGALDTEFRAYCKAMKLESN